MKAIFNFSAAALATIILLFSNMNAFGKNIIFIMDKDITVTMKFYRTDTILVVVPDSFELTNSDKDDIESYVFFEKSQKKPVYKYKSESELNAKDMKKHIILYGPFYDFKRKEFLRIPIKKSTEGFKFQNRIFNQPIDAFFYVNENGTRLYVCKNSRQAKSKMLSSGIGAYPLHVFREDKIVYTGIYFQY